MEFTHNSQIDAANKQPLEHIELSASVITASIDQQIDMELPQNLKDLTMKFEIVDPGIYKKLRRARQDQRHSSEKKPDEGIDMTEEISKQEISMQYPPALPAFVKYDESTRQGLANLQKNIVRFTYRTFLKNCIMMGIKRLEQSLQQAKLKRQPQPQWTYSKLFNKANPTEEQQTFKQFLGHCATLIQSTWKRYITQKRHKQAMKRIKRIKAVVRGWKTRQIYNSNRLRTTRQIIQQINRTILQCENTSTLMQKIPYLYKQLQLNISLFNEQFDFIYRTGGWVFERKLNMPPPETNRIKNHSVSVSSLDTNYRTQASQKPLPTKADQPQIQVHAPPRRRNRQFGNQRGTKEIAPEIKNDPFESIKTQTSQMQNASTFSQPIFLDDRPIKGTGVYALTQSQVLNDQRPKPLKKHGKVEKQKKKINIQETKAQQQKPKDQQNDTNKVQEPEITQEIENTKPKNENVKRLVRKQRYDPRKAIQQQKKRKKAEQAALLQKSLQPNEAPQTMKPDIPKPDQIGARPIKTEKIIKKQSKQTDLQTSIRPSLTNLDKSKKKTQPKVNCWARKPDIAKIEKQKEYYSQATEDIPVVRPVLHIQKDRARHSEPVLDLGPRSNLEPMKIDFEEHFKEVQVAIRDITPNQEKKRLNMERHENFTKNLQRIIDRLQQKKEERKKGHKSIEEMLDTYNSQYMNRFNRLTPKLQKLFFQRSQEQYPSVPIVLHNSIFGQAVSSQSDTFSYRRLLVKLQKEYKFILQNQESPEQ